MIPSSFVNVTIIYTNTLKNNLEKVPFICLSLLITGYSYHFPSLIFHANFNLFQFYSWLDSLLSYYLYEAGSIER